MGRGRRIAYFTLVLLLGGCAPDVMQAARQSQREQVAKLTADLGTPDQVRAGARGASRVLGVMAAVLVKPAASPKAPALDPEALQKIEQALLGEQRRLNAVAASRSDDGYVDAIAELCTPDAMNDAQITADLSTAVALSSPSDAVRTDSTKLRNFQQAQRAVKALAQLMDDLRSRCQEGNAAVAEAAAQAQAQAAEAHREQDIIFKLIAARLSAPRTTVNVSQSPNGY